MSKDMEREKPVHLTEAQVKQAAEGKSQKVMEDRPKPIKITEEEVKLAAQGKSQHLHEREQKK